MWTRPLLLPPAKIGTDGWKALMEHTEARISDLKLCSKRPSGAPNSSICRRISIIDQIFQLEFNNKWITLLGCSMLPHTKTSSRSGCHTALKGVNHRPVKLLWGITLAPKVVKRSPYYQPIWDEEIGNIMANMNELIISDLHVASDFLSWRS